MILVPYEVRDRKLLQAFLDGHLGFDVTDVVALKGGPLDRFVFRTVTGAAIVAFVGTQGDRRGLDQFFTFRELCFFQPSTAPTPSSDSGSPIVAAQIMEQRQLSGFRYGANSVESG